MTLTRRRLTASAVVMSGLPGCARAYRRPFRDWQAFKANFLAADGRIIDTGNASVSHTEGQGYGMLLSAAAGDEDAFRLMWQWTQTHLARPADALFAWRYDPSAPKPVADINNATDGDLLIAWALLRGADYFSDSGLAAASKRIRRSILDRLILTIGGRRVLLPGEAGFLTEQGATVNLAYYIWPALKMFATRYRREGWQEIIDAGLKIHASALYGSKNLPTDWIFVGVNQTCYPAPQYPARFGYDAVRIPLYLKWAGLRDQLLPYQLYWSSYRTQNRPPPAWIDVQTAEEANYPAGNGTNAIIRYVTGQSLNPISGQARDYYSDALQTLVSLAEYDA